MPPFLEDELMRHLARKEPRPYLAERWEKGTTQERLIASCEGLC